MCSHTDGNTVRATYYNHTPLHWVATKSDLEKEHIALLYRLSPCSLARGAQLATVSAIK